MTDDLRGLAQDAPLLAAWTRFVGSPSTPFTVPGHHRRAGRLGEQMGRLLDGDVPLFGGLASVKAAAGDLDRAERLGAELWGADWCRYSTGGSTHANQVLSLAIGRPGDTVLVSRAAHRSTLSGLVLAGLRPVWLPAEIDSRFGIAVGLSVQRVAAALEQHPDAVALCCVEPGYLGACSALPEIVSLAHARDVPVVVDQAWGAHLGFHPDYPGHALGAGADAMILSAHKTLPAYSQASVVAARTSRLDRDRLERAFHTSATTSPSGTILASADASRALLASALGRRLLGDLAESVAEARARLRAALPGAVLPGPDDFAPRRFDPAKLVLLLGGLGRSGNDVEARLVDRGMPVELADRDTLVPIVTMLDDRATLDTLVRQLTEVAAGPPAARGGAPGREAEREAEAVAAVATEALAELVAEIPPAPLTPREAFFAPHATVPRAAAVGRVSAELVAPYPPGVPVLVPGESITETSLATLARAAGAGTRIAYAADPTLRTIQVVA